MSGNDQEIRGRIQERVGTVAEAFDVFRRKWRIHNPDETDLGILQAYVFWRLAELHVLVEMVAGRRISGIEPGDPGNFSKPNR